MNLSLTLLEFRVLLVYYVQSSFSAHYLAVRSAFLYRCSYFHFLYSICLFVSECYPPFAQVIRAHLHSYLVAGKYLDIVHPHLAGYVGRYFVPIAQFHFKHRIRQCFKDYSILFYCCLFRHFISLSVQFLSVVVI